MHIREIFISFSVIKLKYLYCCYLVHVYCIVLVSIYEYWPCFLRTWPLTMNISHYMALKFNFKITCIFIMFISTFKGKTQILVVLVD